MSKAGIEPDAPSTRPLYLYLSSSKHLPAKAWRTLESLKEDGQTIPPAAVNVVIESSISVGHFQEAVQQYKSLHTICSGPNTNTFNVLLQATAKRDGSKDLAMFFASEMRALGVKPDALTYDRLVLVCLREKDYEDAFRYLEEMVVVSGGRGRVGEDGGSGRREGGWWMRGGTAAALVRRCCVTGDGRAWDLLNEMEERGVGNAKLRSWVEGNWKKVAESGENGVEALKQGAAL